MNECTKSDGTIEARTAARWWADQLGPDSKAHIGDATNEMFLLAVKAIQKPPTSQQVEKFRLHLEQTIVPFLYAYGWERAVAEDPQWASGLRTIDVDYGPCVLLSDALESSGISAQRGKLLLPLKTVMWVNPGHVAVSFGYNAIPIELELLEN